MEEKPSLSYSLFTNRLLLLITLTILIASCGDTTIIEAAPGSTSELESSSSESGLYSSSSSIGISSSSSSTYAYFYGEAGKVCDEWAVQVVTASQTYQAYMSMYQTCGDLKTIDTGKNFGGVIYSWVLNVTEDYPEAGVAVNNEVRKYGSSLHFYKTDDGGLNYLYVEPIMDGAGMK